MLHALSDKESKQMNANMATWVKYALNDPSVSVDVYNFLHQFKGILERQGYKIKIPGDIEKQFLWESNAIEDVWDDKSLEEATRAWKFLKRQGMLTPEVITHCHYLLMKNKLSSGDLGFRKAPVWIAGREGKPWYAIPELMHQWIKKANLNKNWDQIKESHISFETIHPFIDGNGRIGRMLLNWGRLKIGLPILVIKEAEKWKYYQWFQTTT